MFAWKRGALLVLLLGTGGCYSYQAVRPADAILDSRVRATVTPNKAAELAPALRVISTQLSGRITERDNTGILVEVPLQAGGAGMSNSALKNRIRVSFSDLVSLEARTLSKGRTAVVLGALVAGVTAGWVIVGGEDKVEDKPKSDVDNSVIPLFSIPLSFIFGR